MCIHFVAMDEIIIFPHGVYSYYEFSTLYRDVKTLL